MGCAGRMWWAIAVVSGALSCSQPLWAGAPTIDCDAPNNAECVSVGEWQFGVAVGYGLADNPVRGQTDPVLRWIPRLRYYGERLFLETRTLGFTLIESDHGQFNLLAWPNADYGWFRDGDSASNGLFPSLTIPVPTHGNLDPPVAVPTPKIRRLESRRLTYLLGVDAGLQQDDVQLRIRLGADLSAGHDGWQAELQVSQRWQWGKTRLQLEVGALYRDSKLSDYYYGVDAGEMDWPLYQYQPEGSLSLTAGVYLHHAWTEQWGLLLSWSGQHAGRPIAESPLIENREFRIGFAGVTYDF